jgi:outer membrane lipoprotein-sorting protein
MMRFERLRESLRRLRLRTSAACVAAVTLLAGGGASAAIAPELHLDEDARAQLKRIEDSLNAVRTMRSSFRQNSSNGEVAQGELALKRPGKLRVEYQPPVPVLVIADGTFLVYFDRKLEQVSYIPLSSTPAGILLDKRISLAGDDLLVTDYERTDGTIQIGVTRTAAPAEGSIVLIFDEGTADLRQWAVTDAQGVTTLVTLLNPEFNVDVQSSLFTFKDPRGNSRGPAGQSSP